MKLPAVGLEEAKRLVARWEGGLRVRRKSILYHARRHARGADLWTYLRRAANFNRRGARSRRRADGSVRHVRKSGEFLIERAGKIVSYGVNSVMIRPAAQPRTPSAEAKAEAHELDRRLDESIALFHAMAEERGRISDLEWKEDPEVSLLFEVEMLSDHVAGFISHIQNGRCHPRAQQAIAEMQQFDRDQLLALAAPYPRVSQYIEFMLDLRERVSEYARRFCQPTQV